VAGPPPDRGEHEHGYTTRDGVRPYGFGWGRRRACDRDRGGQATPSDLVGLDGQLPGIPVGRPRRSRDRRPCRQPTRCADRGAGHRPGNRRGTDARPRSGPGRVAHRRLGWVLATGAGQAVGLLAGAAAVRYGTGLADLALMGVLTGIPTGIAQAFALPAGLRHRWAWAAAAPILWGWAGLSPQWPESTSSSVTRCSAPLER
jgi:hypothetical protein